MAANMIDPSIAGIFNSLVLIINLVYIYYWVIVFIAKSHHHIADEIITDKDIHNALQNAYQKDYPYKFIIQITTKGGCPEVVARGIEYAIEAMQKYPSLYSIYSIEVVTEKQNDIDTLHANFTENIPISYFLLPKEYQTENNTQLKARALEYMVQIHRANPTPNAYIIHYDEESVFTPDNLARLTYNLLSKPTGISEGMISYGLDFDKANIFCRAMESNRPFGCHECYVVMSSPPPFHLHGSNLVILQSIENEIGWDIGTYKDFPLVAEDLVFGLKAFLKYGKEVFGWHRTEMIEQPPFSIKAAIKQRERWVFGALQTLAYLSTLPEWKDFNWKERYKLKGVISLRVIVYAMGFPLSIISITLNSYLVSTFLWDKVLNNPFPALSLWTFLLIPGMIMWLSGTQLGLFYNLRYSSYKGLHKVIEHIKILLITPFAGVLETSGAFIALTKWIFGVRGIIWIPTPKLNTNLLIEKEEYVSNT